MGSGKNFLFVSCTILILATVNMGVGPIMNKKLGTVWGNANCKILVDQYEDEKINNPDMDETTKESYEFRISQCKNSKAMYNMEYTSFIFNLVIGFIGVLIGLYSLQNEIIPKSGMIGMLCGVVGLALTAVYAIFNIIVLTSYYDNEYYKIDSDGAYAEREGTRYKCYFFKEINDTRALYAKYIDLMKSQYNYNKELRDSFVKEREKSHGCADYYWRIRDCSKGEYLDDFAYYTNEENQQAECSKLYYKYTFNNFVNYDKSARILTTLIFSILIILCYLGYIFSGFILNKESAQ